MINGQVDEQHPSRGLLPVEWVYEQGSVDFWRGLCAPLFDVSPIQTDAMIAPLGAHVWRIGPLVFWRSTCGGQILNRTVQHLSELDQHVLVSCHESGRIIGATDCDPFQAAAGNIAFRQLGYPFAALQYPSVVESILIPRKFLNDPCVLLPALRVFEDGDLALAPLQRLFQDTFGALRASTQNVPSELVGRVLTTLREAIARPIYEVSPRRAARKSQRQAIQAYIEQNLGRLDLCADGLLPHFGVSRATLYRMFEVFGGVRNYIVDRRLFHALLDISDRQSARGKIQQAAKTWGFSSAANFNRSVQHAFGGAPGSLFRERHAGVRSSRNTLARQRQASQELI